VSEFQMSETLRKKMAEFKRMRHGDVRMVGERVVVRDGRYFHVDGDVTDLTAFGAAVVVLIGWLPVSMSLAEFTA